MQKITASDPLVQSADVVAENIAKLKSLFPEIVTEGKDGAAINVDVLKQLVGDRTLTDADEKFGLNWHGKRQARALALKPSTGTLRPCPEDSVDWDTTKNLMIEGDNLEVLKLLKKSYAGKVKLIYIDPPYNHGSDLVYPDDFSNGVMNYQMLVGDRASDGRRLTSNLETSGRFHTNWLNMIYPRLRAARDMLREDGALFISIDDNELSTLRLAANEVFGEENFLACFLWKSRQNKDNRSVNGASIDHEYLLCYGNRVRGDERDLSQYTNPDNDKRGPWTSANMVGIATADRRPNLHYDLVDPETRINYGCPDMGWRYERSTMSQLIAERRILWPTEREGRPRRKAFLSELDSDFTGVSSIIGEGLFTRDGTADIDALFETRVFSFPKPVELIAAVLDQGAGPNDIVIDFFAGSGTTGHAVMARNAAKGLSRRFILVQLPEPLDPDNRDQKTAADFCRKLNRPTNIAELTKERLRRASRKLRTENRAFKGDLGFRVFRLDHSNVTGWDPDPVRLSDSIEQYVEHMRADRSAQDLLYELLLKRGLDLCTPIETKKIAGKEVHSVGAGTLIACLAEKIKASDGEDLATGIVKWHKELNPAGESVVIFRDSAFADDVLKTNVTAILEQHGLKNIRSL
ncbi:MAG TPA: site-specific DNA-methyltransferase [Phycisphaerales bacterium]|nr:site-specific DNA-methyltransferase [Phycisphaerales bacterium]